MRTRYKDQSLRDDSNLKVDDSVELFVVGLDRVCQKGNTKLVLEKSSLHDDDDKGDTRWGPDWEIKPQKEKTTHVDKVKYRPYAIA